MNMMASHEYGPSSSQGYQMEAVTQSQREISIGSEPSAQEASSFWWNNSSQELPETTTLPAGPQQPRSLHSLAMPDELWRHYRDVAMESRRELPPADPRHKAVPPSFTLAFPLDVNNNNGLKRSSFGYPSSVFRVMSQQDGCLYCLRRFDNVRSVSHKIAMQVTEQWKSAFIQPQQQVPPHSSMPRRLLDHPALVGLEQCFVAQHRAVFFLHSYIRGARTLRDVFFAPATNGRLIRAPLPEPWIWSIATQLVSAIRVVHTATHPLACRTIHLNHILLTTPLSSSALSGNQQQHQDGRHLSVHINCIGVVDALEFEARKSMTDLKQQDIRDFGHVLLALATGTELSPPPTSGANGGPGNLQHLNGTATYEASLGRCEAFIRQHYSRELHALIMSMCTISNSVTNGNVNNNPTIHDVARVFFASRAFDELDATTVSMDRLSTALSREYESGRALRLMLKLAFINERPEFGMANERWSESGDAYILKLFRDYGRCNVCVVCMSLLLLYAHRDQSL